MAIPGLGPEDHRAAVKRGVPNTGDGIGNRGSLVTPNYGALIGLGVSWRAQPIEKHTHKTKGAARGLEQRGPPMVKKVPF